MNAHKPYFQFRLYCIVSLFVLLNLAGHAMAQGKAIAGEVLGILAKEEAGKIDPSLAKIPALKKPPFNSFLSMQVLSKPSIKISKGGEQTVKLPNGRVLRLKVEGIKPGGKYQVSASLKGPGDKKYAMLLRVMASPGDPFFVAGQSHQGGTLIIGVTLGAPK